jgi:hypothetical protein
MLIPDVIAQSLIGALPTFFTLSMTLSDQQSALVSRALVLDFHRSRHRTAIGRKLTSTCRSRSEWLETKDGTAMNGIGQQR